MCAHISENEQLHNLKKELDTAFSISESLHDEADKRVKSLEQCFQDVSSANELHQTITDVTTCCKNILVLIENLRLPIVTPRWCDLTDAGLGVGVSNFEVKFCDAEMCRNVSAV